MSTTRILVGVLGWVLAGFGLWRCVDSRLAAEGGATSRLLPALWQYAVGTPSHALLKMSEPLHLAVGDPILIADPVVGVRQVGEVRSLSDPRTGAPARAATVAQAEALFYADAPAIDAGGRVTYYAMPESLSWVVHTLLPPERRRRVARELSAALEAHHREIFLALRPTIEQSLRDAYAIVEQDLADALARHRDELDALGDKYRREIVEREVLPLVKTEIWPVVRRHAEPAASQVGKEIWQQASLWRFGWRYAYDNIPLTDQDLVEKEWKRFVDAEAMPVLERHSDELVDVVQNIVTEALRNHEVQAGLKKSIAEMAEDPELQGLLWQITREVIVDNRRLASAVETHWTGPDARRALERAAQRLEPTVRRIGRMLFQSEDGGLTPELARVLRHHLLGKDRRLLLLEPAGRRADHDVSSVPVVLDVCRASGEPIDPLASPRLSSSDGRLR